MVLLARSPYFKSLLLGQWSDSRRMDERGRQRVHISADLANRDIAQKILEGLYMGELRLCASASPPSVLFLLRGASPMVRGVVCWPFDTSALLLLLLRRVCGPAGRPNE